MRAYISLADKPTNHLFWIRFFVLFQTRALELIRGNPRDLAEKVKELSDSMYKSIGSATSVNPYSPVIF